MPAKEDLKLWKEDEEIIRRMNVALYGFDISKLSVKEQRLVEEQAKRRIEVETELARRNPKPERELSKAEELELRRLQILEAKLDKITKGRPTRELSNRELEKQLKVLRRMAGVK